MCSYEVGGRRVATPGGVMHYFHWPNSGGTLKQAPSNALITLITGQGNLTLACDFLPGEIITLVI